MGSRAEVQSVFRRHKVRCVSRMEERRAVLTLAVFVKAKFHTQSHLNNPPFCSDTLSLISYYAAINYMCKKIE